MSKNKVLIITHDLVADQMAGPAIRCWEFAHQLAEVCEVTLTSKLPVSRQHPAFQVVSFDRDFQKLVNQAAQADILIVQGFMLQDCPQLAQLGKYVVVDLYDPFIFESYPHFEAQGALRDATYLSFVQTMDEQMQLGDYFICANERQRDMWLGRFCALGRLTPELFAHDPSMKRLVGLVPFGLPDKPPVSERRVLRGVVPGIGEDDFILLWGGGIWNWFDPLTVIRAVAEIGKERSDIKLYFLGTKHPNPEIPEMAMTNQAVALANDLGVRDRMVFFNHGWVPYDERQAFLKEASAGISAHFDSLETRFSFRTRVLDYLWSGMPILTTRGDGMAELVAREGLGEVLDYGDVAGWKAAILKLADDRRYTQGLRDRILDVAEAFKWNNAIQPVKEYCMAPYHTPAGLKATEAVAPSSLVDKGIHVLRNEGIGPFLRKSFRVLTRS